MSWKCRSGFSHFRSACFVRVCSLRTEDSTLFTPMQPGLLPLAQRTRNNGRAEGETGWADRSRARRHCLNQDHRHDIREFSCNSLPHRPEFGSTVSSDDTELAGTRSAKSGAPSRSRAPMRRQASAMLSMCFLRDLVRQAAVTRNIAAVIRRVRLSDLLTT